MSELAPYVLIRASKKTGNVDKQVTALGHAMLQMWALQNTPKTKQCFIINGVTGQVVFATNGTADGFPKVKKEGLPNCEELGISMEDLFEIVRSDGRFDEYLV